MASSYVDLQKQLRKIVQDYDKYNIDRSEIAELQEDLEEDPSVVQQYGKNGKELTSAIKAMHVLRKQYIHILNQLRKMPEALTDFESLKPYFEHEVRLAARRADLEQLTTVLKKAVKANRKASPQVVAKTKKSHLDDMTSEEFIAHCNTMADALGALNEDEVTLSRCNVLSNGETTDAGETMQAKKQGIKAIRAVYLAAMTLVQQFGDVDERAIRGISERMNHAHFRNIQRVANALAALPKSPTQSTSQPWYTEVIAAFREIVWFIARLGRRKLVRQADVRTEKIANIQVWTPYRKTKVSSEKLGALAGKAKKPKQPQKGRSTKRKPTRSK